ncbi:MAG: GntR family transcriptional regulator [Lentisphaerae bacterium]|nr:GntR family transcriptional regulator [Lentisphaerota bacterium]
MLKYKSEDVVKELVCEIRAGVFKSDFSFPCDRDIAQRFGVSRATAREATSCLKSAGLIASRRGAGTFLAPQAGRGSGIIGAVLCDSAAVSAFREAGGEIARSVSSRGYSLSLHDCVSPSRQKTFAEVRRAVRNLAAMGALGMVYESVGMLFVDGSENCAGMEQSPTVVGIVPDMKRIAGRAVRYLVNHIAHPGRSIVVDLIPPLIG